MNYLVVRRVTSEVSSDHHLYSVIPENQIVKVEGFKDDEVEITMAVPVNSMLMPDRVYGKLVNTADSMAAAVDLVYEDKKNPETYGCPSK